MDGDRRGGESGRMDGTGEEQGTGRGEGKGGEISPPRSFL